MEKFFALLLTTTVLLGLAGCSDKPDAEAHQFPPTVYDGTGGTNGTGANGSPAPENNPGGYPLTPSDDLTDGAADSPGTTYKDMVENGRIRDTDGILSDGENPQN